jgi:hypothetical protein
MIRVAEVHGRGDLKQLISSFSMGEPPFVVVPNWHSRTRGYGTDAEVLDWLLSGLGGEAIVVEAYDAARTDDPGRFAGLSLGEAKQHQEYLREQDRLFLRDMGIDRVLERHGAEYLNVTEEAWSGRVADAGEVKGVVESRYGPVAHSELLGVVPLRLWEVRGSTLVNLAKIKAGQALGGLFFSLSLKNLFGLIPVPSRGHYHGSDAQGLSRAIIDMNQIYCSLFGVISVCEAINASLISARHSFDEVALVEGLGLAVASEQSVEMDAFLVQLLGGCPEGRHFLRMGAEVFGGWDRSSFPAVPEGIARRLREAMAQAS